MYYVSKTLEISASHQLTLSYDSKCSRLHGHNWSITIFCKAEQLDENGMVCDFTHIKRQIKDRLDHENLNDILPFNPTAENLACWCTQQIPQCYKAWVKESEGNIAVYVDDSKCDGREAL